MIKISFHGACREVTGSCTLVEYNDHKFLVDCGAFQGEHFVLANNEEEFLFKPAEIDCLFLTHAHMDHCGRLPKLFKDGFRGKIYATAATVDLAEVMLIDAAKIIAKEALINKRQPLFTADDVNAMMKDFSIINYDQNNIIGDLQVIFRDAGHILGSAFLEFIIPDGEETKKILFSGDLGNSPSPIICDLESAKGADAVIVESTYASASHETKAEGLEKLQTALLKTIADKGTLVVPIFALEKTQEILFELNYLIEKHKAPAIPMFLDSPLAIKAVEIYDKYRDLYNPDSQNLIKSGDDIFNFTGLKYTRSKEDSLAINAVSAPKVVLSSSGMCVGGRIPYHLQRYLPGAENHVLLVSYQAPGSLGRKLMDGEKRVEIYREPIEVRAQISMINSYSSHADGPAILNWLLAVKNPQAKTVFVNHGEIESSLSLAERIQTPEVKAIVPEFAKIYEV